MPQTCRKCGAKVTHISIKIKPSPNGEKAHVKFWCGKCAPKTASAIPPMPGE